MPIAIYNPQIAGVGVTLPGQTLQRPMGPVPSAEQRLLGVTTDVAKGLIDLYAQERQKQEEVDVLAAYGQLQRSQLDYEASYQQTRQGREARTAGRDWSGQAQATARALAEQFKDSPRAQEAFLRRASSLELNSFARGRSYGLQQESQYDKDVLQGLRATHRQVLTTGNAQAIAESRATLDRALDEIMPGRDHTAQLAAWDREDAGQLINQALATHDFQGAEAMMRDFAPVLGEQSAAFRMRLDSMRETQERRALVAKEQTERRLRRERLNAAGAQILQVMDGLAAEDVAGKTAIGLKMANSVTDPALRVELMGLVRQAAQGAKLQQDATDERIADEFLRLPDNQGLDPFTLRQRVEQIAGLSEPGKRLLMERINGGPTETNLDAFWAYETAIFNGDYATEADARRAMSGAQLTLKDQDRLLGIFRNVQRDEDRSYTGAVRQFESNLEGMGVPKEDRYAARLAFQNQLSLRQDELGRTLTRTELHQLALQITVTAGTGKPGLVWGTRSAPVYNELALIPLEAQRDILASLRRRGWRGTIPPAVIVQEWNRPDNEERRERYEAEALGLREDVRRDAGLIDRAVDSLVGPDEQYEELLSSGGFF